MLRKAEASDITEARASARSNMGEQGAGKTDSTLERFVWCGGHLERHAQILYDNYVLPEHDYPELERILTG